MPKLKCNYGVHFTEITQKIRETIELRGNQLIDLINALEQKYKGFRVEFIDSSTGKLRTSNGIMLERENASTRGLTSLNAELRDGDILTFF